MRVAARAVVAARGKSLRLVASRRPLAAPARPHCCPNVVAGSASPLHHRRPPPPPTPTRIPRLSRASAAFATGSNGDGSNFVIGSGALSLEEILSRARASLEPTEESSGVSGSGNGNGSSGSENGRRVLLSGDGRHLGSAVSWKLLLDLDHCEQQLAFREDVGGENLSFSWGYCGGRGGRGGEGEVSSSWEVDDRGVAKELELDDHEALLLAAAVRSGWWASEEAGLVLERSVLPKPQGRDSGGGVPGEGEVESEPRPALRLRLLRGGLEKSSSGGSVEATLTLADEASCLPLELATPLCGGRERWRFEGWARRPEARGRAFPARTTHAAPSGGENEFVLRRVEEGEPGASSASSSAALVVVGGGGSRNAVVAAASAAATAAAAPSSSPFSCPFPTDSLRPAGATYRSSNSSSASSGSNDVPAWWSSSGHLLVRPLIDGEPAPGLFLVDSGASGLVIEREAADVLGLAAFGELFVAGVAGAVRSRFRRAASLSLGPVELAAPLFMEMPVAGVVTGGPAGGKSMRTVGILGHDLFRAAVVTLPRPAAAAGKKGGGRSRSWASAVATRLRLDDPLEYRAPASAEGRWCELRFVSNLPHIRATMPLVVDGPEEEEEEEGEEEVTSGSRKRKTGSASAAAAAAGEQKRGEKERSIMLMVDSGAGGADVMFHSRAAAELGLLEGDRRRGAGAGPSSSTSARNSSRVVRGVGTGSTASDASSSSPSSPSSSVSSSSSTSSPSSSSSSSSSEHLAITATSGSLPWLTLGPIATFGRVRTLAFSPPGGLDLSAYSQGIACADLLSRARVVLDYPRRRMALIPPPSDSASASGVDARAPRRGVPPGKGA